LGEPGLTTQDSLQGQAQHADQKQLYITLAGLPLSFILHWPFHRSTSGADFYVLHAEIYVENTPGLNAKVAVNLTQTVRETLPSLEPKDAEAPVINALRKEADTQQLEFLKSSKLVPLQFSSRHYDQRRKRWAFGHADDRQLTTFIRRKVYWNSKLTQTGGRTWLADPVDLLYLDTTREHILEVASSLAATRLIRLQDEHAEASDGLLAQANTIEAEMKCALEEIEKKHAYERA